MKLFESWKKQITFLQNKDIRTVFVLAFKRQIRVLSSTPGYFVLGSLLIAVYFLFGYGQGNFINLGNTIVAFATFLIILFLRPSKYKKNWNYLFYVTKKCFFAMLILSSFASLVPTVLCIPFVLLSSTLLLLSLDGEYRIKNTFALIKKTGLFFLYTLPTMTILSCLLLMLMKLLKHTKPLYTFGIIFSALLFSSTLILSLMVFMFIYTVDVYEHEQLYFESSEEKI